LRKCNRAARQGLPLGQQSHSGIPSWASGADEGGHENAPSHRREWPRPLAPRGGSDVNLVFNDLPLVETLNRRVALSIPMVSVRVGERFHPS
jgi:hypothetical protein